MSDIRPLMFLLYKQLFSSDLRKRRERISGFTLIELLISVIISGLIITTLLYVVVELATMDKREAMSDQVQRDMKRALDYISDDLQEAVYVYADPQDIVPELTDDSDFPQEAEDIPILAFWRIDPLEDSLPDCTTVAADKTLDCELLSIRQAAYTLIVYVQRPNDTNGNWPGQSRIIRYELPKYIGNVSNLDRRPGYRDPTDPEDEDAEFGSWKHFDGEDPQGNSDVLVDYVQAPTFATPVPLNRAPLSDSRIANTPCSDYGLDRNNDPLYLVSPPNADVNTNNTFFTCIRRPALDSSALAANNGNQDVYIFLRGNVREASGSGVVFFSEESSLPILETQVLVRGVIDKGLRD